MSRMTASAVIALGLLAGSVDGAVLCGRQRPDGTWNGTVKIREACKLSETPLDPVALGLQGPPGPQGEQGPPGPSAVTASVRVYNSSPIPAANDTATILSFDSERWDTANMHDAANSSRLVAPVNGIYLIECHASFPTNGVGARGLAFRVNGTGNAISVDHRVAAGSYYTELTAVTEYQLQAGDYIEAHVAQDSGSTLNVVGYPTLLSPECAMTRLP